MRHGDDSVSTINRRPNIIGIFSVCFYYNFGGGGEWVETWGIFLQTGYKTGERNLSPDFPNEKRQKIGGSNFQSIEL